MNQPSSTDKSSTEIPAKEFPFGDAPVVSHGSNTVINSERNVPPAPLLNFSEQLTGLPAATSGIWKRLFVVPGAVQPDESHHGPVGIQLGHFQIEERIGSGGMGAVFRANDLSLQRDVALKILSPHASRDTSSIQRFLNEARAAARLDHENIARVFYQGEDHGLNYIAFEYVTGQNIRDMIQAKGLLDPATSINYALQIAIALKHTNEAGVIHRDIKPSNIIITPNGRAKLVDLGLARKQNSESVGELTVAGTTLGTFDYISPEQAKDPRKADIRSDIYSLGCTLYHMLTGTPPYPEGTVLQKLLDHQGKGSPDPCRINPHIPQAVADVVKKMMSSQPSDRHSTPEELIRDLSFLARGMGLRGMHTESLVWQRPDLTAQPNFLQKHLGWILTAAALVSLVIFIERFPGSTNSPSQPEISHQTNINPKNIPPQKTDYGSQTIASTDNNNSVKTTIDDKNTKKSDTSPVVKPEQKKPSETVAVVNPQEMKPKIKVDNPDVKPIPVVQDEQPSISIIGGKTYKTLEAACLEAKDGDVIELAFNGRRPGSSEKSIRIAEKKITIRAGKNKEGVLYQPLIEFAPTENSATDDLRLVSLINGSIDLYDINISIIVNEEIEAENWILFSMQESEKLRLKGVHLTVQNPGHRNVAIVELSPTPGGEFDDLKTMNNGANGPASEFLVKISESFIQGDCNLFVDRHVLPGLFDIEKSIIAIEGTLLKNYGDHLDMPQEGAHVDLQLEHVTAIVGSSLIDMQSGTLRRERLPVYVTARNNIFATNTSTPFVTMFGGDTIEDQLRLLRWQGEKNFYDQFQSFWTIESTEEVTKIESHDFDGWLQIWKATQESSEVKAQNKGLKWQEENWLDQELADINVTQLRLDSNIEESRILHAASDGSDVGADLSKFRVATKEVDKKEVEETEKEDSPNGD